jgi:hypothetical protein
MKRNEETYEDAEQYEYAEAHAYAEEDADEYEMNTELCNSIIIYQIIKKLKNFEC